MQRMKNLLLVLGGTLDALFLKECYEKMQPHFVVAADGALEKVLAAGIPCNCGMGDFDTVSKDVLCHFEEDQNTKLLSFPPEKDETDAELAVQFAVDQKPDKIWILTKGIECEIIDQQNRIRLLDGPILLEKMADWKYVSFLSYTDQTQGITLKGFVYNVENFTLKKGSTRCISNEICDEKAAVSFTNGLLYCIRSRDLR